MRPARWIVLALVLAAAAAGARWLWIATSVGSGYAAKVSCSLVHNSRQPLRNVLEHYVLHEVAPLGVALSVEDAGREVRARVAGIPRVRAVHREGLGCTLLPGLDAPVGPEAVPREAAPLDPSLPWPAGGAPPAGPVPPAVAEALERAFAEPDPAVVGGGRRNTTAVAVVRDGKLLAERYAPGYGPDVPMLSWSMAKSVTAALVGLAIEEGRLDLHAPAPVPEWQGPDDPRRAITLDQLLRMSSGLAFDETYGAVNDVSRMLFTQPDTGAFAASFPLAAPPDTVWSYSSGTTNIVARLLRDAFGRDLAAMVRWSRARLFDPADMTSAFLEPDASGSFIGSSFAFMTARDWARFGELHLRDGIWHGRRVLPEAWVAYVTTPTPTSPDRRYGAHWWLNAGNPEAPEQRMWPTLPRDLYAARGHSGQYVIVSPQARLVVVRLGLSTVTEAHHGIVELMEALLAEL